MFGIFANSFMAATGVNRRNHWETPSHWAENERFDNRRNAEIEAHTTGRRRD